MAAASLSLQGLRKVFEPAIEAVGGVDLELPAGTLTALVGPSGCGKTTLLRCAGGLDEPTAGRVERDPPGTPLGVCFQEPRLLPWRSLLGNAELPLEIAGRTRDERRRAARRALELVGLADAEERLPRELSGGMKMRAALARALVGEPGLLLLDEPFSAVDEVTRFELDQELDRLRRAQGLTALLVTHSIQEAVFLADEVVVSSPRPARIVERFPVSFGVRDSALRASPEFAQLVGRVHASLRAGMAASA